MRFFFVSHRQTTKRSIFTQIRSYFSCGIGETKYGTAKKINKQN